MIDRDDVRNILPRSWTRRAGVLKREGAALLIDSGAWLSGEVDRNIPPMRLRFVGRGNFTATGCEFLRYFTEYGGMKPDNSVLDVGCGIGRMAIPMTKYLKEGRYRGFDIVETGINRCRENITPKHPNFEFPHADIYNKAYNPNGAGRAADFGFPCDDSSFDFAFATSVFTHMPREDTEHYLTEIGRALKPGGSLLSTWFLLNDSSRAQIAQCGGALKIVHRWEGSTDAMVRFPEVPVRMPQARTRRRHWKSPIRIFIRSDTTIRDIAHLARQHTKSHRRNH